MKTRSFGWFTRFAIAGMTAFSVFNLTAVDLPLVPPLIRVLATDPAAAEEGTAPATFTVIRTGPTNLALTVHYTLGGSAENGVDYEALPGVVTIPEGAFSAHILVKPIDDFLVEGAESVILSLLESQNVPPLHRVAWPGTAVVRIEDNDRAQTNTPPTVVLVQPPEGAIFQAGDAVSLVAHAGDRDGHVTTVEFFADTNSLGVVMPPPVPLPPLAGESVPPEFAVDAALFPDLELPIAPDLIPVPTRRFHLVWANAPAGQHTLTAVATDDQGTSHRSAPVAIKVLDAPPLQVVEVKAVDPVAAEPGANTEPLDAGKFLVFRHGPMNLPLDVFCRLDGSAANGVDYAELPSQVTIPAGERGVEVVVRPLHDELVEGPEHVRLTLLPPVTVAIFPPPPDVYEVGRAATASVVIRDGNVPPPPPLFVRLIRPQDGEMFLAGADIRLAAMATAPNGTVATVEFFEGTNSLGTVTNNAATLSASAPAFQLVWTNVPPGRYVLTAEATDSQGAAARSAPVEIKVVPHVEPPLVRIETVDPEAAEVAAPGTPNPAVFRVSRIGPVDAPLTIFYRADGTASNGVDYEQLSGHVTIPAGQLGANIEVAVLDDLEVEGTETVVLTLVPPIVLADPGAPVSAVNLYRIGADNVARAIIRDNEPPPANLPPKVALRSPQDGSLFVAPADIPLVAGASDPDGTVQSVEFFNGTNSLGAVTAPVLTNLPTVAGYGPMPVEQMFQLVWSNAPAGTNIVHCEATDDKGAVAASASVQIRVVEHSLPPVVTIETIDPDAAENGLPPMTILPGTQPPTIIFGTNAAVFAVRRTGPIDADLKVYLAFSGTAEYQVDYLASPRCIIPSGAHEVRLSIFSIDDQWVEGTETVIVALMPGEPVMPPLPPPPGQTEPEVKRTYIVGEPSQATAFIRDNDFNAAPKVEIVHPRPNTVFAAPAQIEIEVVALDPDGWVPRVDFFADNQLIGTRSMQFLLPPAPGQPQRFSLVWSNAPVGNHILSAVATDDRGGRTRADGVPVVVVNQPELPRVGIQVIDGTASEQCLPGGQPDIARFKVFRVGSTDQPLTVHCQIGGTASNGVDYVALPNQVTIPQGAASVDLDVVPVDDTDPEATESVIVTLLVPNATVDSYVPVEQNRAVAFILDNDVSTNQPPVVALLNPADNAVFQAPTNLLLVAAAVDWDGWVRVVEFFDGTNSLGVVTNSPWVLETEPMHVPGLNANTLLADRTLDRPFMLMWSNVAAGPHVVTALATDNAGASARSRAAQITVRATNDVPLVSIAALNPYAREGANLAALFEVRRTGPLDQRLTVFFTFGGTASNGVDYLNPGDRVDFAAGFSSTNILIFPLADDLVEGIETIVVRLVPSSTAPESYRIHSPSVATMFIVDSDSPPPASNRLRDGSVLLQMPAPKGLPYRLEASDDLIHWEPVLNHIVGDNGIQFLDDKADVRPRRFLRIVPDYTQTNPQ